MSYWEGPQATTKRDRPSEDRPPEITFGRRRDLARLAEDVAEKILASVEPGHERYLFRRMLDNLLND